MSVAFLPRVFRGVSASIRNAFDDRAGTYSIVFALSLLPLVAAGGLAIDYGRALVARDELQFAVDSATLAAARRADLDGPALEAMVRSLVGANSSFAADDIDLSVAKTDEGLTVAADITTKTYLLPVIGYEQIKLSARSDVMVGTGDIEVALILDVTGSMCSDGVGPCTSSPKLDGLKTAAQMLIDTVVNDSVGNRSTRVSLVPFSTRVRVGPDGGGSTMMAEMTNLPATWTGWYNICIDGSGSGGSETDGDWVCNVSQVINAVDWKVMPCVTDRFYNSGSLYGATDAAPGPAVWLNGHGGDRAPLSWDSSDEPITSNIGASAGDPATFWSYSPDGYCADVAESNELVPLTKDKALLLDRIANLEAFGSTAGALGTAVAWYTLSPNWSSVFTGDHAPASYSELAPDPLSGVPRLKKAAVLMTDGVFNTYRGWKEADQQTVSDYAVEVCQNMKAAGIAIYTVGFALDELSAAERAIAEATLNQCSTDSSHYYDASTVAELTQAFQSIGSRLSALRITR